MKPLKCVSPDLVPGDQKKAFDAELIPCFQKRGDLPLQGIRGIQAPADLDEAAPAVLSVRDMEIDLLAIGSVVVFNLAFAVAQMEVYQVLQQPSPVGGRVVGIVHSIIVGDCPGRKSSGLGLHGSQRTNVASRGCISFFVQY